MRRNYQLNGQSANGRGICHFLLTKFAFDFRNMHQDGVVEVFKILT